MVGTAGISSSAGTAPSAWAPFRAKSFRMLWIAQLSSNVGTWMQTVGAQWMLVHQPNATALTSAVQAASLLPVLFLSLPAGVLADVLDRRSLLITLSGVMAALCAALSALTAAGLTTPAVLIALTFVVGCGQALMGPGWQAIQPELVPRAQIPAAAALGSLNVNLARAVGPAIAGLIVAATGPEVVFGINAASFLGVVAALLLWRRPGQRASTPERLRPALASGTRYVRNAPGVRRLLLRSALFVVPASALWGLLPVVSSARLGLGSSGYGLLLGALGLGAIAGAVTIKRVRTRLDRNALLAVSTVAFALGTVACATLREPVVVGVALVVAGVGWLYALSTLNTTLQLALPGWVRARGLALYLMVFLGGQGVGTLLWGLLAGAAGTRATLLVSTGLLLAAAATLRAWPLHERTGTLDRDIVAPWPEPALDLDPAAADGPVLVEVTYQVPESDVPAFQEAMASVAASRRRTGATAWSLYRDVAGGSWVEVFQVASWGEHLRQHGERLTGYDADLLTRARTLTRAEPTVRHLVPPPRDEG
ncbi:Predicted arabinose efflux permease, MFS family [Streptomyces sp. DvalAA-14]|uniref:MFS transporter n=1 Tax=unclassified Streptomyces TaxID=2593676 RepID=UPI00081AF5F0|nr:MULTISPECIES: MFS transporter [unclassified Streptomyces]MYS20612.1 MFS transporter [Streptomyces sp. SID4948]SCD72910.1 Predicted arabinose efflux permease, MFS family [Streptomyces sp. DvalAA-14]